MKRIDEPRLETDLEYRIEYLMKFMGLDENDTAAIHGVAAQLGHLVPALVDAVYVRLFEFDATKRHFVPRQAGYEGDVPGDIEALALDHAIIQFRKQHLGQYFAALVSRPYESKLFKYLDLVGRIHTPKAGSENLNVPLVQMNALMGFVSDALIETIHGLGLEREIELAALRAFNKVLWLQNDLISRHYV